MLGADGEKRRPLKQTVRCKSHSVYGEDKMKFKGGTSVAVFTRNHRKYLEEARERNVKDPVRFTAFRSGLRWTGAHSANVELGPMRIYFAPVRGEKVIEYQADLHQVHLDPSSKDPITQEVLACELESTRSEGLWEKYEKQVKTLYVISRCELLKEPFPITELIKVSDGKCISENYGYSYCLVLEQETGMARTIRVFPDELAELNKYIEGGKSTVSVAIRKRSASAKEACLKHYGCACTACGFDFERTYGDIGKGFIHVHHLRSLSSVEGEFEVDPIRDLSPVCPNCHAMIHKIDPPLAVEELRTRLSK